MQYMGDRSYNTTRQLSTDPRNLSPASPIVADHTSASGVTDNTVNQARGGGHGVEPTPLTEKAANHCITRGEYILAEKEKTTLKEKKDAHSEVVLKGARIAKYENTANVDGKMSVRITGTKGKGRGSSLLDVKRERGKGISGKVGLERFLL